MVLIGNHVDFDGEYIF